MAKNDDLESLLGVAGDEPPASEPSAAKESAVSEYEKLISAKQALEGEKEKLRKEVTALREERRGLKAQGTGAASAAQPAAADEEVPPQDFEGWKKFIDNSADKKVSGMSAEFKKIQDSQKAKAVRKFVESHPEYASDNDPSDERLNALMEVYGRVKSRTDYDADDILEDLEDSWAVRHRAEIVEKAGEAVRYRKEIETATADIASSGGAGGYDRSGAGSGVNATSEDHRIAKSINMPIDKYLKLRAQQESMEIA